jgi:hypothetical protein
MAKGRSAGRGGLFRAARTRSAQERSRAVPRYYLNLFNSVGPLRDEEGHEYPDLESARQAALSSVRSILSEEVLKGRLDLKGRIEVSDGDGAICAIVPFAEAISLRLPGRDT